MRRSVVGFLDVYKELCPNLTKDIKESGICQVLI
jgi:hypothetical protein